MDSLQPADATLPVATHRRNLDDPAQRIPPDPFPPLRSGGAPREFALEAVQSRILHLRAIQAIGLQRRQPRPTGESNRYPITAVGSRLTALVTGQQIVDIVLSQPALQDRPAVGWSGAPGETRPARHRTERILERR